MTRRRPLVVRALLGLVALLVGLGLVELVLRATGSYAEPELPPLQIPGQPASTEPFSRPDELLIFSGVPGSHTWPGYTIEAHGYRTPPFEDRKAPGTFRIIVTGDSTTFGFGMRDDQPWAALLRRAVAGLSRGEHPTELINAGTVGYSTLQSRYQIRRDLLPLDPDLLIAMFCGPNDSSPVEGPSDKELSARMSAPAKRLASLRIVRALGLGRQTGAVPRSNAPPDSLTAEPRVSVDEVQQNVEAMADMLGDRLVLAQFLPIADFKQRELVGRMAERVKDVARARDLPLADPMPAIEELLPFPVYQDQVHPSAAGHVVVARAVLATILPKLELSPQRTAWCSAWFAAAQGELAARAGELTGAGAPPRFAELLALYARPDLDQRLAAGDTTLPATVRDWDPLHGARLATLSLARLVLADEQPERRAEIAENVRPTDPLVACFGGEAALAAADDALVSTGRALVVYGAELGLPPLRADLRRGRAAHAETPAEARQLLEAVLALDPDDGEARFELAVALRRLGERDAERTEYERLAEGTGAMADLAAGLIAFQDGALETAEAALRRTVAAIPFHGWAHYILGQALFRQDRLDEAAGEMALAAVMLGTQAALPAQLAQIDQRRIELGLAPDPGR